MDAQEVHGRNLGVHGPANGVAPKKKYHTGSVYCFIFSEWYTDILMMKKAVHDQQRVKRIAQGFYLFLIFRQCLFFLKFVTHFSCVSKCKRVNSVYKFLN